MNTLEIRKRIAEYMEVGFTMSESFKCIRNSKRVYAKRSGHKLAEFAGNNENRTFNQLTKEYQYN